MEERHSMVEINHFLPSLSLCLSAFPPSPSLSLSLSPFPSLSLCREVMGTDDMWPWLMALGGLPAIIQFVTLLFFPEAPRYLYIDKGDTEGSKKGMHNVRHFYFICYAGFGGECPCIKSKPYNNQTQNTLHNVQHNSTHNITHPYTSYHQRWREEVCI